MTLNEYLKSPGAMSVSQMKAALGVRSDAQIRQWQHGYADRRPGPASCVAIERVTGGRVTRRELRPEDWHLIWPELVSTEGECPVTQAA